MIGFEDPDNPASELSTNAGGGDCDRAEGSDLKASVYREIDAAFASLAQARTGALRVGDDAFFNIGWGQIVALAVRHASSL
jgi:hypothetical protein